jgi:OmpA-OmpF porin, OOP family
MQARAISDALVNSFYPCINQKTPKNMSLNLLDLFKDQVGGMLADKAASMLGEEKSGIEGALSGIVPSLLGTLVQKGSSESGAGEIMNMLTGNKGFDGGMLDNLSGLLGGGEATNGLLSQGGGLLNTLLGGKQSGLIDLISSFAGIKKESTGSLMGLAAPFLMSLLGKQVKTGGLNIGSLMGLLGGQGDFIKKALPPGLAGGIGSLLGLGDLGDLASKVTGNLGGMASGAQDQVEEVAAAAGGGLGRWLPLLLALVGIGALLWFLSKGCEKANPIDQTANAVENAADKMVDAAKEGAASVSAETKKVIDDLKAKVKFDPGTVGEKMVEAISSGRDLSKEVFLFKTLNFASGKADITPEMNAELDQVAEVMKAFPDIKVEIGGHTDNVGDPSNNRFLSQKRANSIQAALESRSITKDHLVAKGYGPDSPVADNATPEGKAANRRIEVRVMK